MLYHVSDREGITLFEPRPAPSPNTGQSGAMVWAVDGEHLRNYLFPRDCPRICFRPVEGTSREDSERLMGGSSARSVVVVERAWYPEIVSTRLHLYTLPTAGFECIDAGAGYWIARQPVVPLEVMVLDDLVAELLSRDVELRVTPSFGGLPDLVARSTMEFSMIRMRNAGRVSPL